MHYLFYMNALCTSSQIRKRKNFEVIKRSSRWREKDYHQDREDYRLLRQYQVVSGYYQYIFHCYKQTLYQCGDIPI